MCTDADRVRGGCAGVRLEKPARALQAAAFRLYRRIVGAIPGGRIDTFGADASRIEAILVINLDRQPRRMARTVRELARFRDHMGRRLTALVRRLNVSNHLKYPWTLLPGEAPSDDWWPPLCLLAGMNTPAQAFPSGAPSDWRLFRDGRGNCQSYAESVRPARPMAMDDTPWAIGMVDGWTPTIRDPVSPEEERAAEMWCPLTEPSTEMPAIRGTFPGNLANFESDAIGYGPDGATITLSASAKGDRPFRSGALSSARRFLHGRFEIEMRAAKGEGLVSGFFLHRSSPRQEIDIEIIGNEPSRILFNVYFNPGN